MPYETKIDFKSPRWNRDAWSRIQGDMDPTKERISHCSGLVLGVKPGEKVRELLGFQTFLATRLVPLPDGNIRRLNKEVIFYTDVKHGRPGNIIHEWKNPWTGEVVPVVHVFNDPFNYTISDYLILKPEDFPGGDKGPPPKIPLLFPWQQLNKHTLVLQTDMHLNYPSPLQPDKWPRESSGTHAQVSEMMRYFVSVKDLENPDLTAVPYHGTWLRITPWLPWMLMGQTPGHCLYTSQMTSLDSVEELPADVREFAEKHHPGILQAPTEDYGPSHSSLEHYSRQQTPAPVK